MPAKSRFQIAKPDIVAHFDGLSKRVLRSADITSILEEKRAFWRLTKSTTVTTFINDLARKGKLRAIGLSFPQGAVSGWTWGEVPFLEVIQHLVPHSHYSHYTAVRIHGLTEQQPKTVYITQERPRSRTSSPPSEPYPQDAIDTAFARPPRVSSNEIVRDGTRYLLLFGADHGELGVTTEKVNWGGSHDLELRTTTLERTLIDIAVRPSYAGGVAEVARAYESALGSGVSINRLAAMLQKLAFGYPYHQAIGYYLERAGYRPTQLDLLRKFPRERDFYLTHEMGEARYVKEWRLFVPKGF
jgi:predicted transcriptional regulator of viral defense system